MARLHYPPRTCVSGNRTRSHQRYFWQCFQQQRHHGKWAYVERVNPLLRNANFAPMPAAAPHSDPRAAPRMEIRTNVINWPVCAHASFTGPKENLSMMVKPNTTFERFTAEDFGLRIGDADAHCPSLYIIRKSRNLSHADIHQRSEAGKKRDAERRREKKRDKKRAHIQ